MKGSFFFILLFLGFSLQCQTSALNLNDIRTNCCARLDLPKGNWDSKSLVYEHLIDLIINNLLQTKSDSLFITDRSKLHKVSAKKMACDRIVMEDCTASKIRIEIVEKKVALNAISGLKLKYNSYMDTTLVEKIFNKTPYGLVVKEDSISQLTKFKIRWGRQRFNLINDTKDLVNVNICNGYKSIQPASAYLSADRTKLFVYLFGFDSKKISNNDPNIVFCSYMVKFVLDKNLGLVSRIIIDESILRDYNWMCDGFIGF